MDGNAYMYKVQFSPGVRGGPEYYGGTDFTEALSPGVRGWTDVLAIVQRDPTGFPRCAGVGRSSE